MDIPTLFLSSIGLKLTRSRIDAYLREILTMAHWIRLSLLCMCKWTRKSDLSGKNVSEQYLLLWKQKWVYCVYRRNLWSSVLCTVLCTLHSALCTLYSVLCALYSMLLFGTMLHKAWFLVPCALLMWSGMVPWWHRDIQHARHWKGSADIQTVYIIFEKGIAPNWLQGIYDQLSWRITDNLSSIFMFQNKSLNLGTCHVSFCHV